MEKPAIALSPYARTIGIEVAEWDGNRPILALDCRDDLCGNPGMFHGGLVGGILDIAAVAALEADLHGKPGSARLVPLNSTVEYLRAAGEARTFASARIVRAGRRLACVQATLWQESESKPVAVSLVNIAIVAAGP